MDNFYFENIRVISPAENIDEIRNLWIRDGKIEHCSPEKADITRETKVLKGDGLVASPGLFDMHVHLREPGQTHKETIETGTNAAANGGFTGVVCMPNTDPAIDSVQTIEYILNRAKNSLTEVFCCAATTKGRAGKELAPMRDLYAAGALMFSDDGAAVESAEVMRRAYDYVSDFDGLLSQHCEEHSMTKGFAIHEGKVSARLGLKGYPSAAEDLIIARDILLAEYCGNRRYHVSHMSTSGGVRLVREAKARGQRVTCEVTPHHFMLTDEAIGNYNSNAKMNPPLRTQKDVDAILQGLADGTVDVIATDHAPHTATEKEVEFINAPNGIIGLETSLGLSLTYLYHTKILDLQRIIEVMSVNPRRILQLPEISFKNGEVANVTIFAPDEEWTVQKKLFKTKSLNMPFENLELRGKPKFAINRGKMVECEL
jgi:dihydroorotase